MFLAEDLYSQQEGISEGEGPKQTWRQGPVKKTVEDTRMREDRLKTRVDEQKWEGQEMLGDCIQ